MAPSARSAAAPAPLDRLRAFQRSGPMNRRCADCVERGPTYVCSTFQTFVCQTCSGIHREFGHKIKSISLSDWSHAEVEAFERAGGNDAAAARWLATWIPTEAPEPSFHTPPDQVREFLRTKYVQRAWFAADAAPLSPPPSPADPALTAQPAETDRSLSKGSTGDLLADAEDDGVATEPPPARVFPRLPQPARAVSSAALLVAPAPPATDSVRACGTTAWAADFGATPNFGTATPDFAAGPRGTGLDGLVGLTFDLCSPPRDSDANSPSTRFCSAAASEPESQDDGSLPSGSEPEPAEEPISAAGGGAGPLLGDLAGLELCWRQEEQAPQSPSPVGSDDLLSAAFADDLPRQHASPGRAPTSADILTSLPQDLDGLLPPAEDAFSSLCAPLRSTSSAAPDTQKRWLPVGRLSGLSIDSEQGSPAEDPAKLQAKIGQVLQVQQGKEQRLVPTPARGPLLPPPPAGAFGSVPARAGAFAALDDVDGHVLEQAPNPFSELLDASREKNLLAG